MAPRGSEERGVEEEDIKLCRLSRRCCGEETEGALLPSWAEGSEETPLVLSLLRVLLHKLNCRFCFGLLEPYQAVSSLGCEAMG